MLSSRIQIVLEEEDKAAFRAEAARAGKSLSAWLREEGRRFVEQNRVGGRFSAEELQSFFSRCHRVEGGREPDWEEHLEVIGTSTSSGGSGT